MHKLLFFLFLLPIACFSQSVDNQQVIKKNAPRILTFEQLRPLLNTESDSVFIFTFGGTYCPPCIKEIPFFERIQKEYGDRKVKITYVLLDPKINIDSHVKPFIEKHNIQSEVIVLDDKRSVGWMLLVDETWQGSIPATLVFNKSGKRFLEMDYDTYELLFSRLKRFLPN